VVGLERGPLNLVRITEELLERKSGGSGLENRECTAVGTRFAEHTTPSTSKSRHYFDGCCGQSIGIVRLRTSSHGVYFVFVYHLEISVDLRNYLRQRKFEMRCRIQYPT
jgi:hypothetical protein